MVLTAGKSAGEIIRDVQDNLRLTGIEQVVGFAGAIYRVMEAKVAGLGEAGNKLAALGGVAVIPHRELDILHVHAGGITENEELNDRREEDKPEQPPVPAGSGATPS